MPVIALDTSGHNTDYKHLISPCEQHDTLVPHRHNEIWFNDVA